MSPLTPPDIPPGFLERWCHTLSEGSESPPGAFLPSGLALLSAIVGPRMVMRWNATHVERMNVWVLNVGLSALGRKTSGLSGLRQAIKWAREDGDDLVRVLPVGRISDAGLVASLDVVGEETAKAKETNPDLEGEVVRPVPVAWVAEFNEVAPIWVDETSGWIQDAQKALLSIFDGRLASNTRATRVPAQECFVTAIGNIPPGVLREQTTLRMLTSGFVGRWLVVPTPPPTRPVSFPMPGSDEPILKLRREVDHLMRLARSSERVDVNRLWSAGAREFRDAWYSRYWHMIRDLSPDDALGVAEGELFGRQQSTALKVATLMAVSEQAAHLERLDDLEVMAHNTKWACGIIDSSISYMTETLQESGATAESPLGRVEERVLRHLERVGAMSEEASVTITKLCDGCKGGKVARGDVLRAVDSLLNAGRVEVVELMQGVRPVRRVWATTGGEVVAFPVGG